MVYDNVEHILCWCLLDLNALKKTAKENQLITDKTKVWENLVIKIKYKMILKRFEKMALLQKNIIMLSEYWDAWLFSLD